MIREKGSHELAIMLQTDVDEDGTIELHEFFRTRTQQILAARGALPAQVKPVVVASGTGGAASSKADAPPADSGPSDFCPNCGKKYISAFCTGCGTPRDATEVPATSPELPKSGGHSKKKSLKKGHVPQRKPHGME